MVVYGIATKEWNYTPSPSSAKVKNHGTTLPYKS
jgi:hypothetical protein